MKKLFQLLIVTLALGLLLGACSADTNSNTQELAESSDTSTTSGSDSVEEETAEVIEEDFASEEDSVELGELI